MKKILCMLLAACAAQGIAQTSHKSDGFDMVYVYGGTFTMGCTSEQGADCYEGEKLTHQVTVGNFYLCKYEITQAQWTTVMGGNPSYWSGANLPVEGITWVEVQEFIDRLNLKTGKNYRLPTEAEWEFAARGGRKTMGYKYSGSNNPKEVAWYSENAGEQTHPVGTLKPNELGLHDMSGNVWEWCSDYYDEYDRKAQTNPTGPVIGVYRALRGSSWDYRARYIRVSRRDYRAADYRYSDVGFRIALSAK
ncbi:MAG: formylglycine-generating enzyme family protein [Prevotellaceae bacterium]|nr:formylglycine-generating enzyme family protein [Prevotellaceae bacterium]